MMKEITPTPAILAKLNESFGGPVDPSKIAIFEAIALNRQPINKRGSIYDKAVPQLSLLDAMSTYVQSGGAVPLHTLHMQGCELPVGRVFMADVLNSEELRVLFYLSRDDSTVADLITKLNSGVIDEVSCGIVPAQFLCSECNFDYFGSDATVDNLWDRTCPDGHVLGADGVHGVMEGMGRFYELSLVSLGAAKNAKIVGRAKQRLGQEQYQRLAASGFDPEITALFGAPTGKVFHHQKEAAMADQVLTAEAALGQIVTLSADKAKLEVQLTASAAQVTDLTTKLEASAAQVATLTTERDTARTEGAEGLKLKEEHTKVVAFLTEQTRAAMVASGAQAPVVPADVTGMLAALDAAKVKLFQLPAGGVALAAAKLDGEPAAFLPPSAFTTRK